MKKIIFAILIIVFAFFGCQKNNPTVPPVNTPVNTFTITATYTLTPPLPTLTITETITPTRTCTATATATITPRTYNIDYFVAVTTPVFSGAIQKVINYTDSSMNTSTVNITSQAVPTWTYNMNAYGGQTLYLQAAAMFNFVAMGVTVSLTGQISVDGSVWRTDSDSLTSGTSLTNTAIVEIQDILPY